MALALARPDTQRKRANLLRIKLIATGLLPVMALLFVVSAHYKTQLPALAWLEAFAEAALVGGLADWFAVVALFRHPGGLPLPTNPRCRTPITASRPFGSREEPADGIIWRLSKAAPACS